MVGALGTPHLVVVDDEADLREGVQEYLVDHGYCVSVADGGRQLRQIMSERAVDLVILDVNMPEEDGLSIARYLRGLGPIGIVMLTANRDMLDRVVGLEVGADDYICKPFELRELLARVRALMRRIDVTDAPAATMGHEIRIGRCMLNLESRRLFSLTGAEIPLTAMEFDLLQTFARHPGKVLTREQLLDLAHNMEMSPFDRSIDMRIGRLRRKIEADPGVPESIKTVRGAGYIFVPPGV